MTDQAILREFMQRRLNAKPQPWLGRMNAVIADVKLDDWVDHGWSEYTPGDGWHLTVECFDEHGNRVYVEDHNEGYTIQFIHDLCRFAAEAT